MAPQINADTSSVTEEDMSGGGGDYMSIETGEYPFIVVKSTYKPNNKNNGWVLGLQQQCLDPAIGKRVLFDHLNLVNPSEDAVKISLARLKQLALAVGHPTPDRIESSEDLHGKPYILRVVKRRAKPDRVQYADSEGFENVIAEYKPFSTPAATPPADAPPSRPSDDDVPF